MATVRVMSVVPSRYWAPEVDQIELAGAELAVGGGGHAVVDDGPVRARARDGVEADLLQRLGLAADGLEALRDGDLVEPAAGRLAVEPGEEAHDGGPVALVGGAGALDLGRVLARLGQQARVGAAHDAGLAAAELAEEPARRRGRIEPDALVRALERRQPPLEGRRLGDLGQRCQVRLGLRPDLGGIDEQLGLAACGHDGEGQRHGVVRDVTAADVEQPGDGIGQRQDHRVLAFLAQGRLQLGDLLLGRLAGVLHGMRDHRALRWGGPLATPDAVDRIGRQWLELDALGLQRLGQVLDHGGGVQPGIEAHHAAGLQVPAEPVLELGLRHLQHLEGARVDLRRRLHHVAPVDQQRRGGAAHHGQPGRAREARQPLEPLGAARHVLALVLVGARHQHGVEPGLGHQPAQLVDTLGAALARFGGIVGLEHAVSDREIRLIVRHPRSEFRDLKDTNKSMLLV